MRLTLGRWNVCGAYFGCVFRWKAVSRGNKSGLQTQLLSLSHKAVLLDFCYLYVCLLLVGPLWTRVILLFFLDADDLTKDAFMTTVYNYHLSSTKGGISTWLGNRSRVSTTLLDNYHSKIVMLKNSKYTALFCVCRRRILSVRRTETWACCCI